MSSLRVYTFSPRWGLPTAGPFALKLLAWLAEAGIAHEQVFEDRPDKGPLSKSPWIEQNGRRMGDSDAIIAHLADQHGRDDPFAMRNSADAARLALKLAFEERFHQILEWELFVHPAGGAEIARMVREAVPPVLATIVCRQMIRHFSRQLNARGIGRLEESAIAREGERLLTMLRLTLDTGEEWLSAGGAPDIVDFAVWGQLAPMLCWPMETPVSRMAKATPAIIGWHERLLERGRYSSVRQAA